jgi:hypothetical protein
MYQDMTQFGLNNFKFEILEETTMLKEREQYWIDQLNPNYNRNNANGLDFENYKEIVRKGTKRYLNRICLYEDETLTLGALSQRFYKQGIPHPTQEAKKYLIETN